MAVVGTAEMWAIEAGEVTGAAVQARLAISAEQAAQDDAPPRGSRIDKPPGKVAESISEAHKRRTSFALVLEVSQCRAELQVRKLR
jgi:hypothetical protein